jgi:myo-inositol 2-dehydrogenase/D-chiro-inositol 1-dehydrogenase
MTILTTKSGTMICVDNSRQAVYGYDQRVEVFGSKGMILNKNDQVNNIEIYSDEKISRDRIPYFFLERYKESYITEMQEFIDSVRYNRHPSVNGEDGLQAVLIAKAALRSYQNNCPVKLSDVENEYLLH